MANLRCKLTAHFIPLWLTVSWPPWLQKRVDTHWLYFLNLFILEYMKHILCDYIWCICVFFRLKSHLSHSSSPSFVTRSALPACVDWWKGQWWRWWWWSPSVRAGLHKPAFLHLPRPSLCAAFSLKLAFNHQIFMRVRLLRWLPLKSNWQKSSSLANNLHLARRIGFLTLLTQAIDPTSKSWGGYQHKCCHFLVLM